MVRLSAGVTEPELVNVTVSPFAKARDWLLALTQLLTVVFQRLALPSPTHISDCGAVKLVLTTLIVPLVLRVAVFHITSDASGGRIMLLKEPL